jgi:hypothetical protein
MRKREREDPAKGHNENRLIVAFRALNPKQKVEFAALAKEVLDNSSIPHPRDNQMNSLLEPHPVYTHE